MKSIKDRSVPFSFQGKEKQVASCADKFVSMYFKFELAFICVNQFNLRKKTLFH